MSYLSFSVFVRRRIRRRGKKNQKRNMRTTQMKVKLIKENWSWKTRNFSIHSVITICIFVFLAGFFTSSLFFHSKVFQNDDEYGVRMRAKLLESKKQETKYNLLRAGESGDNSITLIPFQVLSWRPRTLYFPNFLSSEQCQTLIDMARDRLKPSSMAFPRGVTKKDNKNGVRTSYGAFLSASDDKTGTLDLIEEKIARATKFLRTHFEGFNVLRYQIGQKYDAHFDSFVVPELYGPQKSQRVATFLMYLSDVEEGGETVFPFENGMNMDESYDFMECTGLKVKPHKGDAILFYSFFPNATIDWTSAHKSCPVIKGEKWAATKWIRDQDLSWFRPI